MNKKRELTNLILIVKDYDDETYCFNIQTNLPAIDCVSQHDMKSPMPQLVDRLYNSPNSELSYFRREQLENASVQIVEPIIV